MGRLPDPIETYIDAYNRKDVEGMLMCLAENVVFQNISGGEVTAEALDKQSFAQMARFGASAFETRHQKVVNAITVAGTTLAEIDYTAVVATDLPNGWKAGQKLAFSGASAFRVEGGKIISIVDES
ncbi:nuclear transport factor 2 family protein [Pannonibacter indicus]|uniref:nuclear transport factor 2 family protein n=1 Tax=Pannonibacter indicus TaxID=466044 RepID=UPI0035B2963B